MRLRYYPVRYVFNGGIFGSSEEKESESPSSVTYIDPLGCVMVPEEPDLWFCDPPEELDTNLSKYEKAWRYFFSPEYIRWCLSI